FLDAFANYSNFVAKFHTVAINWPVWKEVGIGADGSYFAELEALLGVEDLQEEMLKKAILTDDGLVAFRRALNSNHAQIIVSPESPNQLLVQSHVPFGPTMHVSRMQKDKEVSLQNLSDGEDQPTNEVEKAVAEIWRGVFGIEQLGIHHNFSQLGGHSLLAM